MMPSQLTGCVDRPERFLALHFAIGVWDSNIGEVMRHSGTDPAVFDSLLQFAAEIGLVPIPIHKEQGGYIINSLVVPWLMAALDLAGPRGERLRQRGPYLDDRHAYRHGAFRGDRPGRHGGDGARRQDAR